MLWLAAFAMMPPVSFELRAGSVQALLAKASAQYRVPLLASPVVGSEIVIASIHGAPVSEFKRQLATVLSAEWEERPDGSHLVRPASKWTKINAAIAAERLAETKAGLAQLAEKAKEMVDLTDLATRAVALHKKYHGHLSDSPGLEESIALSTGSPGTKLAIAAVLAIPPADIATMQTGDRVVYSDRPTALQRPYPLGLESAIAEYMRDQNRYVDELHKMMPQGFDYPGNALLSQDRLDPAGERSIIVERSTFNPFLTVDVKFGTKSVRVLLDIPAGKSNQPEEPFSGTAELSTGSQQLLACMKELQSGKTFLGNEKGLHEMARLSSNDPLSYVTTDGLLGLAHGRNMIACVSDDGFMGPILGPKGPIEKLDLGKFSTWLKSIDQLSTNETWVTARPKNLLASIETRIDRKSAEQFFFRALDVDPSFDDIATFVAHMPKKYDDSIVPMLAFFFYPLLNKSVSPYDYELVRIYGRLNPVLRKEAMEKGIVIRNLDAESKDDLLRLVFRADSNAFISTPTSATNPSGQPTSPEKTREFAKGLPDDGTFRVSQIQPRREAAMPDGVTGSISSYDAMEAGTIGWILARGEAAPANDPREQYGIKRYRYGFKESYSISCQITPTLNLHANVTTGSFAKKSVPYDQLPESFRRAIEKAKDEAAKNLKKPSQDKP